MTALLIALGVLEAAGIIALVVSCRRACRRPQFGPPVSAERRARPVK